MAYICILCIIIWLCNIINIVYHEYITIYIYNNSLCLLLTIMHIYNNNMTYFLPLILQFVYGTKYNISTCDMNVCDLCNWHVCNIVTEHWFYYKGLHSMLIYWLYIISYIMYNYCSF